MIHVLIGTKAEYIKTAPVMRELDRRGVPYRLVDLGQHSQLPVSFRTQLGVREPDLRLDSQTDAASIGDALKWAGRLMSHLRSRSHARRHVFGGMGGVCLVHGDTPSTIIATLMGRRAGVPVAHLESGLRSKSAVHPFPEELTRRGVMRLAHTYFPPNDTAERNLRARFAGRDIVPTGHNTSSEAIGHVWPAKPESRGPALITIHRVENLHRRARLVDLVTTIERLAKREPVRFLVHQPTENALRGAGLWERVLRSDAQVGPLIPHDEFIEATAAAPWVLTDGGSSQEECAVLGVPTLLWRATTERDEGLGHNVVLTNYDARLVDEVTADPDRYRRPAARPEVTPSSIVVDRLVELNETVG